MGICGYWMWAAEAIITQDPWHYMSSPPCSPARDMEKGQQCREAARTVGFEITLRALEPNLCNCKPHLCMWELQTGAILVKHPCFFQEWGCAARALGTSAVCSIPLQSPGDLDKLVLHGKGGKFILQGSRWDEPSSKSPWKTSEVVKQKEMS